MHSRLAAFSTIAILAGCASPGPDNASRTGYSTRNDTAYGSPGRSASGAYTLDGYKREIAERISQVNADKVYPGRPQALLRSVVVLKYVVDIHGNLLRSEIVRSNRDHETEATALTTLRNSAPFPKPASHLLHRGHVEISETWLFNNDGRFQLRTIAQPQMDS
jgi:protein TonB